MRISDWSSDVCSSDLACDRSRETTTSVPSRPPSFREPSFIGTPDRILEIVSIVTFAGGNAMRPGAGCGRFREQSLLPRITRINADKADRGKVARAHVRAGHPAEPPCFALFRPIGVEIGRAHV